MIIFFKDPEPEKFKTTIDILQPLINDHNHHHWLFLLQKIDAQYLKISQSGLNICV